MKRIKNLQTIIKQKKLSAVLITNPINVRYLCGFIGTNGKLLVSQKKATLITDFRYLRVAKKQISKQIAISNQKDGIKKIAGKFKTLGLEGDHLSYKHFLAYRKKLKGVSIKSISGLVEGLRIIKDKDEIKIIKKAVTIANKAFKEFIKTIMVTQSGSEMEWSFLSIIRRLGGDGFSFPPIICFGKNTANVHHMKSDNKLKRGDKIMIDFGIKYKGYCTDMTRMIYTKKPSDEEQELYLLVLKANKTAIKSIKTGMKACDLDKTARDIIEKAGYGEYFGHATGHGIGLKVHELPKVSKDTKESPNKLKIKPGMVFTIEPGIYSDKFKGGVRIEDMAYVNKKGKVEVLTKGVSKEVNVMKI